MKIQEADAKALLLAQGLPVPPWEVARTPTQARAAAVKFLADPANATGKVVIKAQVLVGGRGKAGWVKIQEADAKALLLAQGLPVPPWEVARTPTQARTAAVKFLADPANATGKVVIKAQVLVGGRGKAGGVKLAGSADEAEDVAAQILALEIKGLPVRRVLVGPAAEIVKEYYLSVLLDRSTRRLMFIGSAEGGVEIEQTARTTRRQSSTSTSTRSSGCPTTPPASWPSRSDSAPTGRPARRSPRAS